MKLINTEPKNAQPKDTTAMCMQLEKIGSQYLAVNIDKNGEPFDDSKTNKVVLFKEILTARFWPYTAIDNRTRSMLQTPQLYLRAVARSIHRLRLCRNLTVRRQFTLFPSSSRKLDPDEH